MRFTPGIARYMSRFIALHQPDSLCALRDQPEMHITWRIIAIDEMHVGFLRLGCADKKLDQEFKEVFACTTRTRSTWRSTRWRRA